MANQPASAKSESTRRSLAPGDQNVLYVQRPVKSVTQGDQQGPVSRILIMVCGVVALVIAFVVSLGVIGLRVGFEGTLGIPHTTLSFLDSGILGIAMIQDIPSIVLASGDQILLLPLLGLVAIAFPLAFIAMSRPRIPGGPPLSNGTMFLSITGAVVGAMIGLATFIWLQLPFRSELLTGLPLDPNEYQNRWRPSSILVGSIDVFAFLSTALWLILLFRLPLVDLGWKYLRIVMIFIVLCAFVGMGSTLGLHQGLSTPRPLIETAEEPVAGLLLGQIEDSGLLMSVSGEASVYTIPAESKWTFLGQRSVDQQFGMTAEGTD